MTQEVQSLFDRQGDPSVAIDASDDRPSPIPYVAFLHGLATTREEGWTLSQDGTSMSTTGQVGFETPTKRGKCKLELIFEWEPNGEATMFRLQGAVDMAEVPEADRAEHAADFRTGLNEHLEEMLMPMEREFARVQTAIPRESFGVDR